MGADNGIRGWQARHTLVCLGFIGLAIFYSLRFNLSIAIVAMVKHPRTNDSRLIASTTSNTSICPDLLPSEKAVSGNSSDVEREFQDSSSAVTFQWDELEQGAILGCFFWGYVLTQLPGGLLAQKFGGKLVIGFGILLAGLLSLVLPWAAVLGGKYLVMSIRVLQGLAEGLVIPAFVDLFAKWTSPKERGGLATICFSGMPFGTAVTMLASGHLITNFGWPSVFYVPGILTLGWFLLWIFLVYSNPRDHPRISAIERDFILSTVSSDESHQHGIMDVPWKDIFCSVPFWAILLAHFTNVYGLNTLNHEGPKYLNSVLHFDIKQNAYIAATPHITQWLFCIGVTKLSDALIRKDKLSVATARKLCNSIGQWGTAVAYFGIILAGCNPTFAVICFMLCGLFNGAVFGGFLINPVDISPNYAGAIEGLINGVSNIAGFGAPYVAGLFLYYMPSITGWYYVFAVPMIVNLLGNLIFIVFSSAEVQPWNAKAVKHT